MIPISRLFYATVCCLMISGSPVPAYPQQHKSIKPHQSRQQVLKGHAVSVADGDTFTLLNARKQQYRIRLAGIDAPEKGMPYYKVSKQYLGSLLQQKKLHCVVQERDRYKRYVAEVYVVQNDGSLLSIAAAMIQAGMAWQYRQYSKDTTLTHAEQKARKLRKGLWQDPAPTPPWTVRAYRRAGISDAEYRRMQQ